MGDSETCILYVEDDAFSRKVVEVMLKEEMNFSCLTVFNDSEQFIEKLLAFPTPPSIILLDIQMKPLDGYEVIALLKADETFKAITTIALTANVMAHDIDKLKACGFDGLIGKPIMSDIFPELIEKILSGQSVWYIP